MVSDALIIIMITILASLAVIWYFAMRRRLARFMRDFTLELERVFKPKDKTYHLLGYLVGYRAVYSLEDGSTVYVLFTTAPVLSLFYYPIAKLLRREDEVTLSLNPKRGKVKCELHALLEGKVRLRRIVVEDLKKRYKKVNKAEVKSRWGVYEVYYEDPCNPNTVSRIANTTRFPIYRLSAYKGDNLISITSRADVKTLKELRNTLYEFASEVM